MVLLAGGLTYALDHLIQRNLPAPNSSPLDHAPRLCPKSGPNCAPVESKRLLNTQHKMAWVRRSGVAVAWIEFRFFSQNLPHTH